VEDVVRVAYGQVPLVDYDLFKVSQGKKLTAIGLDVNSVQKLEEFICREWLVIVPSADLIPLSEVCIAMKCVGLLC
jgi:hypothetical protein